MITLIQNNRLHRSSIIQFGKAYIIILFRITEYKILNDMQIVFLVVDSNIHFWFSKSVLTSWIHKLFNLKPSQSIVICVSCFRFKRVNATIF